jgi:hypothetical protein
MSVEAIELSGVRSTAGLGDDTVRTKSKTAPAPVDTQTAFLKWLAVEVAKEGDDHASELIEMANGVLGYFDAVEADGYHVEGLDELTSARAEYNGPGIMRAA